MKFLFVFEWAFDYYLAELAVRVYVNENKATRIEVDQ